MKNLLILSILVSANLNLSAQDAAFEKGSNLLSAGVGLGSSILNYSGSTGAPALNVQFERGMWEVGGPGVISLGAYVGRKNYNYSMSVPDLNSNYNIVYDKETFKWSYSIIGLRSAYHYNGLGQKKLDLYGGLMLSYNLLSFSYEVNGIETEYSDSYGSATGITEYVGARYFFLNRLAAFGEVGYGVSYLTLGVSVKL